MSLQPLNILALQGVVTNPAKTRVADGQPSTPAMGIHTELLVSEIHGKRYVVSARGNLFVASFNGFTGGSPLAPGGTTSGLMLQNPVGSGVNLEVHAVRAVPITATDVVAALGLEYGSPYTTLGTAAATVTMPVGGPSGGNLGKASYGSTIVAMAYLMGLPAFVESTGGIIEGAVEKVFDGDLVLAPGSAINIVSTTTQGSNKWLQDIVWSEFPA